MGTVGLTGLNNDPQFWHAALYIIHLTMLLAVAVPRNIPLALLLALAREGAALAWTSGRWETFCILDTSGMILKWGFPVVCIKNRYRCLVNNTISVVLRHTINTAWTRRHCRYTTYWTVNTSRHTKYYYYGYITNSEKNTVPSDKLPNGIESLHRTTPDNDTEVEHTSNTTPPLPRREWRQIHAQTPIIKRTEHKDYRRNRG